jgi:hypothetical protein
MKNTISIYLSVLLSTSAIAQELVGIKIQPAEIAVSKAAEITLEFKEIENQSGCNVLVSFGDGRSEDVRVEAKKTVVTLSHTYDTVGNFPISAEGKTKFRGFNTVFGCSGDNRAAAIVVREENYADKAAAAEEEAKVAYERAAAERKAAQAEAKKAGSERAAAGSAAKRAAADKQAAERAANAAAADRAAQERAAAKAKAAAEKAAVAASEPSRPVVPPKKAMLPPVKAGSATDL